MSFEQGLNVEIDVEYLLLLSFLTTAEFCNLGHLQGHKTISFEKGLPIRVICTSFRSDFEVGQKKIKTNIQYSTT